MRKMSILAIAMLICISIPAILFAQEDIKKYPSCKYCGMNREQFAHSRMLVEYDDGSSVATCSIHCLAVDLALNIDKTPKSIQVGDYGTKVSSMVRRLSGSLAATRWGL